MIITLNEYSSGAPLRIDTDTVTNVSRMTAAQMSSGFPGTVLAIGMEVSHKVQGDLAAIRALILDADANTAAVDTSIAAAVAAEVIARNAAIAAAVAAAVDASGYAPVFVQGGGGVHAVMTAPDGLSYTRIGDMVTITGIVNVDTATSVGSESGPIGTMSLPATALDDAGGIGAVLEGYDITDVWPTLDFAVLAGGTVATVMIPGSIGIGFSPNFAITLTIRIG